ncbi:MAG: branched-chain amino acid ABC transporter permease [Micromonosporaceae bacterium]
MTGHPTDRLTDRMTERQAAQAASPVRTLARHLTGAAVLAAVLLLVTYKAPDFRNYQIAQIAYYVVAVAGLTVLIGMSGQISLGHGAFMAIGAYVTALVIIHLNWPVILAFVAATASAALVGALLGVAAARLRGPYLAGATLILAVALPSLANRFSGVLGGDQGLSVNITVPAGLGASFPPTRWLAWITCATALVALVLLANLARSKIGRQWRAVRDDEVAAALAGLNVARLRVLAFIVSAAAGGLAGAMLAITTGIVAPTSFTLTLSIGLVTAAVVGGLGSLAGAVWGSMLLVLLPTYATNVATSHGLSSSAGSNIPIIAYGVALVAVMLMFPNGIQGGLRRLGAYVMGTRHRSADSPSNPSEVTGSQDGSTRASEHQEEGPV